MVQHLDLYMVSDSSAETVTVVSKAVTSLFETIKFNEYMWPLVRSKSQVDELMHNIKKKPDIVIYTILDKELRQYLKSCCQELKVKCLSPISDIVDIISEYCGVSASKKKPGKAIFSDENYFKRIEALNFTIAHDDGQQNKDYNTADILITGVSRTSKTPTSLYLAQRGYKVANWPIINNVSYDFSTIKKPLIVGLFISANRLIEIRNSRLLGYDIKRSNDYTSALAIKEEINYAKEIFLKENIPTIDVTYKAIEEVAAEIINLYFLKKGEHLVS